MKEVIHKLDDVLEEDCLETIKRSKGIFINSRDEIILGMCNNNYHLIGGHVDENEDYEDCLKREVLEETGYVLKNTIGDCICTIKYISKEKLYIAKYFEVFEDIIPDMSRVSLTEEEKVGKFHYEFIKKDKALDVLRKSLETCTNENVVLDTIKVLEIYLGEDND